VIGVVGVVGVIDRWGLCDLCSGSFWKTRGLDPLWSLRKKDRNEGLRATGAETHEGMVRGELLVPVMQLCVVAKKNALVVADATVTPQRM
jgi:hypothetical protein